MPQFRFDRVSVNSYVGAWNLVTGDCEFSGRLRRCGRILFHQPRDRRFPVFTPTQLANRDEAFADIAAGIRKVAERLRELRP